MKNENGIERSAILKGQTLVNLSGQLTHHEKWVETGDDLVLNLPSGNGQPHINVGLLYKLKKDTVYTVVINMKLYETGYPHICFMDEGNRQLASDREWTPTTVGVVKTKFTTSSTVEAAILRIIPRQGVDNIYTINKNIIILEGDHTQEDIPYFEGMQSVKNSQTLVNIIDYDNISLENATDNGDGTYTLKHAQDVNTSYVIPKTTKKNLFKPNTKYLLAVNIIENNTGTVLGLSGINCPFAVTDNSLKYFKDKLGWQFKTLTTNSDIGVDVAGRPISNYIYFGIWKDGGDLSTSIKFKFMLIEYQEGMENWDIPYFEDMQSVKMPVLCTTGKNLFNPNQAITGFFYQQSAIDTNNTEKFPCAKVANLKGNVSYTISSLYALYVACFDINGTFLTSFNTNNGNTITLPSNANYILIRTHKTYASGEAYIDLDSFKNDVQIEEGSIATTYEPYKSNILTVNEDVTLRGVGEVRDELNLLTGELTERIGEIVLDGSEVWKTNGSNNQRFFYYCQDYGNGRPSSSNLLSDKTGYNVETEIVTLGNITSTGKIQLATNFATVAELKEWLSSNPITVQYILATPTVKTVNLSIQDQDNQPQERMKLFPTGYINTSSSTFPPILELKGITHNNKLNMTTTNGTNNTQLATLDNLALDGIICREGTIVRDSYDVESGLYTKRVFRFTIDEEFVERYRGKWGFNNSTTMTVAYITTTYPKCANANYGITNLLPFMYSTTTRACCVTTNTSNLYITLPKEEVLSQDVDGILEWIKRNGTIEVAYQMATPQIIHMQPNMTPYVSTRPYQGSIESQGNILESSYLDYTSEQSIISPKPLGDGDVLRWEQGSQCYVYENDKEYIPLTDYNQPIGTVLDLEEEDGEQYVENVDGGDIIVDVPFKEKAVYERHLIPYEDKVIYPTQDKLDPTGKIEVDYICGETWQNPNDLSDIRHVGTLREDGQYDVTIRRSGDDEIRLLDGTTHLILDGEGLNPSEFELTFFNSGGVEVGKYGDTIHTLEDCVLDSKLETGTVYGQTMVNLATWGEEDESFTGVASTTNSRWYRQGTDNGSITNRSLYGAKYNPTSVIETYSLTYRLFKMPNYKYGQEYTVFATVINSTHEDLDFYASSTGYGGHDGGVKLGTIKANSTGRICNKFTTHESIEYKIGHDLITPTSTSQTVEFKDLVILEGDYTNYPMDIPLFEGVGSTIVNGFSSCGKNLFDKTKIINNKYQNCEVSSGNFNISTNTNYMISDYIKVSPNTTYTKTNFYIYGAYYDQDKQAIKTTSITSNTFTTPSNAYYIVLNFRKEIDDYENAQLELNTLSTPYEPYKGITYTLPTPITLNKVGDVVDTYDVVSGKFTQRIGEIILDGSEDWTDRWGIDYPIDGYVTFNTNIKNMAKGNGLCENFAVINNIYDANEGVILNVGQSGDIGVRLSSNRGITTINEFKQWLSNNPITVYCQLATELVQTTDLIPSTVETMQQPTFILPQPLRSVPNGICDRLYWDENKGHYCIEKRIEQYMVDGSDDEPWMLHRNSSTGYPYYYGLNNLLKIQYTGNNSLSSIYFENFKSLNGIDSIDSSSSTNEGASYRWGSLYIRFNANKYPSVVDVASLRTYFNANPMNLYYPLSTPQIIDLPHLNKKLTLPTQPDTLPIGYKVENPKANPQLGLTIPYKQLNYPSRPQNIDFKMDIADYVLTWDDVKEARQYNVILNDRVIATVKEPQWNSGEEMYGYIMVEAQNELADNLSEELYIKTVPNAPAQLTVAHNPMTDYYDFEISFIKTSAIAEYYTVQYRIDNGEWVYKTIQSDEIDPNSKVLWSFSVYEIHEQIEVWATATNDIGTNDILPTATYYMSPTPQWTYRINSKELFVRWMDDSPYDTQYKLRYQYKSDGIYRYAYFEGDKQEIGKLYEALIPLADDEEVSIALCVISEKENLYTKPIKASKELDPNIKPPKNFNYHWLARGLIEFYWEDNYDVDVEYEAIVEHRLTSGNNEWITDTRIFSATDTEGTGTVYRLSYQLEDLEEIRVKVRMKWAMNETEWSESLTTVFIPVEGNPPQWIRRTQTQEGLLVEWEAQEYVDSYHVYVMSNGEELQHLETMDNFIYVDLDYSNPIDIEIYEATRFSGGIQSDPSGKMCFRPTMDKQQMIYNVVIPDTLTYEIEVDTVQKGIKERQEIHDINTTPGVKTKEPMDVAIKSPFTLSFHPLQLDVHQAAAKYYGTTELNIKTLDVKSRDAIEVLSFERVTDQYGVDFTVYTPSASKYPITLEVNRVRIVCFGDSLTSGHPGFWAETGTGDPQHCYEYWLDRRLKGQYEIINKGYGSDTTDRMLARFDRDVLANNPQYCIIQGGTNDLYWAMAESMGDQEALNMKLDVMKANIMEMVKRCWDNNIVPIVGNLIPRTGATGIYKTALYDFNAWIISWCTAQAAEGRNIFYVDLFNAGKEAVPPTPIEDPTNPGAMNPIYDGDALFDEFGNIIKQGRGIHLNKEGYRIWAEAIPLSIFKTYDSGLRMYKDLHCTDEDNYDDSDKQNPFYTISIDNVRRSKTKTVVRYIKNIGKTQVLFAMYASDEYNMSIEFVGSDGEKGAYANGLLAPNMIAKVTMEINLDNKDSKASFNLHLAAREYNQN